MKPVFDSEAALCAAHIRAVEGTKSGWTAYAETAGWDILYVHADGTQVGIQAKKALNIAVLTQAIDATYHEDIGPDFRAILVPRGDCSSDLCSALGLTLIQCRIAGRRDEVIEFWPELGSLERDRWSKWHYRNPARRHALPRYVPDVPAGVPGPSTLTDWKIAALEVCAVMELRGWITREDFRRAGIDHRRWVEAWLAPVADRPGAWTWRSGFRGFALDHPKVYPQVLEDVRKKGWAAAPTLI